MTTNRQYMDCYPVCREQDRHTRAPGCILNADVTPDDFVSLVDAAAKAITSAAADGRTIASPTSAAMALLEAGLLAKASDVTDLPTLNAEDEMNCAVVTGAVWMALAQQKTITSVTPSRSEPNVLTVEFEFMKSGYRIVILPEDPTF